MKDLVFCKNLKRIRESRAITQNELEIVAQLPLGVVSFYETGTRSPGWQILKRLECSANALLF